ncbi:hypothetical protein CALVIDRAFT_37484 [Calocera viscosa TUFC12733]|uniref:Uncharacterized protein n=1 Tax=Calocera viscosa (strain TUFC12733) TaxID=1330018 RepID=A0A167NYX6_CALVF|nr:hypothetical protein CALVIDRAFT_37484 [Calocera viscosa TUFC12733]
MPMRPCGLGPLSSGLPSLSPGLPHPPETALFADVNCLASAPCSRCRVKPGRVLRTWTRAAPALGLDRRRLSLPGQGKIEYGPPSCIPASANRRKRVRRRLGGAADTVLLLRADFYFGPGVWDNCPNSGDMTLQQRSATARRRGNCIPSFGARSR